jgi:hypothetical protein
MSYWLCGAMWRLDYKTLSSTSEKLRDVISKSEQIVLANSLGLICTPNSVKLLKETQWPQELLEAKAIEKIESKMHNWNIFTFPPLFPSLVEAMWCYFFASGDKRAVLVIHLLHCIQCLTQTKAIAGVTLPEAEVEAGKQLAQTEEYQKIKTSVPDLTNPESLREYSLKNPVNFGMEAQVNRSTVASLAGMSTIQSIVLLLLGFCNEIGLLS